MLLVTTVSSASVGDEAGSGCPDCPEETRVYGPSGYDGQRASRFFALFDCTPVRRPGLRDSGGSGGARCRVSGDCRWGGQLGVGQGGCAVDGPSAE